MDVGDWPEGQPQWWWKFVYPARDEFWARVIASHFDPSPEPWVQTLTADVLEGVAMVRAAAITKDAKTATRLKEEGFRKITEATQTAQGAKAA